MKKLNNQFDIITETTVFDYVAGHMSQKTAANFEQKLASSQALQKMVDDEKLLRTQLKAADLDESSLKSINEESLDKLLSTIDELDENSSNSFQSSQRSIQKKWFNNKRFNLSAIAASTVFAIVLFFNQQTDLLTPKYELLSNKNQTSQIEFNELITTNKVAQIWLDNDLSPEQLSILFNEYELTPIGRAGQAWVVTSEEVLSKEHLASLKSVKGFKEINLISYD